MIIFANIKLSFKSTQYILHFFIICFDDNNIVRCIHLKNESKCGCNAIYSNYKIWIDCDINKKRLAALTATSLSYIIWKIKIYPSRRNSTGSVYNTFTFLPLCLPGVHFCGRLFIPNITFLAASPVPAPGSLTIFTSATLPSFSTTN